MTPHDRATLKFRETGSLALALKEAVNLGDVAQLLTNHQATFANGYGVWCQCGARVAAGKLATGAELAQHQASVIRAWFNQTPGAPPGEAAQAVTREVSERDQP